MKLIDLLEIGATEMCATAGVFGIRALWRYFRQIGNKIVVDTGAEFIMRQKFWDSLDELVWDGQPVEKAIRALIPQKFEDYDIAVKQAIKLFSWTKHKEKISDNGIQDLISLED